MAKSYYMPTDDTGKVELLEHLVARLPSYAELLNVSADELAALKADAAALRYVLTMSNQAQYAAKNWVSFKNVMRDGGSATSSGVYPPVTLSGNAAPEIVPIGIIPRITAFVSRIKTAPRYTEAIGQDLGIVGSIKVIDPSTWQPALTLRQEAGTPVLEWPKGHADALEIWVERTPQGGFSFLDASIDVRYADTTPIPATPAVWRYKAIYRLKDEHAGEWSGVVSVVVGN